MTYADARDRRSHLYASAPREEAWNGKKKKRNRRASLL